MANKLIDEVRIYTYRFKDYLIFERKLSENSVYSYYNDISQFLEYLEEGRYLILNDIFSLDNLDGFLIWLYRKNIKARSIVRKLSSISLFMKFLKIESILNDNQSYLLDRPKFGKKLPNYLTVDELNKFLNAFDETKPEGIRDRTLFELIYSCGLRVSEVSGLNIDSIFIKESVLKVHGKGKKDRFVPIGVKAVNELNNYLNGSRPCFVKNGKKTDALFLNYRGERLTRKGIWKNLKNTAASADIKNKSFTVHTLRHSFATHLLQNGADLLSVQKMLGHKNIITTEIYTHLDMDHIRKTYEKFHIHG